MALRPSRAARRFARPGLVLMAALLMLAGCEDPGPGAPISVLREAIASYNLQRGPRPPDGRLLITPAVLDAVPTALFVERPDVNGAQSGMTLETVQGEYETWQDGSLNSVVLRQGILVGTRGFGDDLSSAEIREVIAAVHGGASRAVRVHRRLDGLDQLRIESYVCDYSRSAAQTTDSLIGARPATLVVESCSDSRGESFENLYWLDAGGVVRQSRQWGGDNIGDMVIVRLKG